MSLTTLSTHRAALIAALTTLALVLVTIVPADAQPAPFNRGIDAACLEDNDTGGPFTDVSSTSVHAEAIDCLWIYGVAQGSFADGDVVYEPGATVSREQMASFIARTIDALQPSVYALRVDDGTIEDPPYADAADIGDAHRANVTRLDEAGIVQGTADGTFQPSATLNRAQMASFVVRMIEEVTGTDLEPAQVFDDISGVHADNIRKLAGIGVTAGTGDNTYSPDAPITREAMGSFLARTMDLLATDGLLDPVAFQQGEFGETLGLMDVNLGVQDAADRVTVTLEGDDNLVGWRVRYVDEARQQGSGFLVDVEGDAILEVVLIGVAPPSFLPDELQDDAFTDDRVSFDGDAIVEVVNDSVFEGQQVLFIGTTGKHPFTVQRLLDPQRVFIDIEHP
jgi:hypothetical protein